MNNYQILKDKILFSCGCEFKHNGNEVSFNPDLHDPNHTIDFECPTTYELLREGLTEGVFQLCSPLGKSWCVKLEPTEIEHLIALGSLLRPGCLQSKDSSGNNITVRYERKKNLKMSLTTYHPIVDKILKKTYGENIFQEQSLELAKQCAGFTLSEADILRKGIGKKIASIIADCKKKFIEKGIELGIFTKDRLEEIFSWIEASQRYSFNRSHATGYGVVGYITAYQKCHFPLNFYKSWLIEEDKRENYTNFVNEAKLFHINIYPPDLRHNKTDFYIKNKHIYFGLHNIKGLVKKDLDSLTQTFMEKNWKFEEIGKEIDWLSFLSVGLESVSSKTAEALIHSGSLDCFNMDRAKMFYEYERWNELSNGEKKCLNDENGKDLSEFVRYLILDHELNYKLKMEQYKEKISKRDGSTRTYKTELKKPTENRRLIKLRKILEELAHPLYNIQDTVDSIIFAEENLLGVALSKHKTDEIPLAAETATCLEVANGRKHRSVLKVKIDKLKSFTCKNGEDMCFMDISDKTTQISAIAFSKSYTEYRHLLTRGNLVFMSGQLGDKGSFIVDKVYSIG